MKRNVVISAAVFAGLMLELSSCATRDASRFATVPVYQGWPESAYSATQTPLVTLNAASTWDPVWPLALASGTTNITIYQPQIDSWDGHLLVGRNAVSIQAPGQTRPVYGVITIRAITLVDKLQRTVALEAPAIVSADFPSARPQTDEYLRLLRDRLPKELKSLSLDQLQSSLAPNPQELGGSAQPLNNTPPKIVVSTKPAILVSIDGEPVYRLVPGTDVQRVINTPYLLLKDKTGQYYLRLSDHEYLKAATLNGPWNLATRLPAGITEAEQSGTPSAPQDLSVTPPSAGASQPTAPTDSILPTVYVAKTPTELINFDGAPDFVPVSGTHLLYASNTTANVFKLLTDQRNYVLLAGRWFSAPSLDGPWQFVPGSRLPSDFANVPDSSPKENVKASVPGTPQAAEALIDNSIPQSGQVERTAPMQDPQIDGPPQLRPIEGTPLFYVVNSGTPIIKVADQSWYACQNGVWFTSESVNGPWTVANTVPPVIYTIPVTSPLHYVTYVRVYGPAPNGVYEGYTPGYLGTEVSPDGMVVYGTGYPYPPWTGDDWYGGPMTWGLGWDPFWTPWDDWAFGLGFGWGCGYGHFGWWRCHPPGPRWGPYAHWGHDRGLPAHGGRTDGWVNTSGRLYPAAGIRAGGANRALAKTSPGTAYGYAYNSRTGALVAGRRGDVPRISAAPRNPAGGAGVWNKNAVGLRGNGTSWQNRGTSIGSFHSSSSFPSATTPTLPFSSSGRQGDGFGLGRSLPFSAGQSVAGPETSSHSLHSWGSPSSGYGSSSFGGRGAFGYGGEAFGFPRSGGSLGFSHGGGMGGFSHGGFSSGSGGGFSHGGGGGSSFGGGHGGGGGGGGGGGHR